MKMKSWRSVLRNAKLDPLSFENLLSKELARAYQKLFPMEYSHTSDPHLVSLNQR